MVPFLNFFLLMFGIRVLCKEFGISYNPLIFLVAMTITIGLILLPIGNGYYSAKNEISNTLLTEFSGADDTVSSARVQGAILRWWYAKRKNFLA